MDLNKERSNPRCGDAPSPELEPSQGSKKKKHHQHGPLHVKSKANEDNPRHPAGHPAGHPAAWSFVVFFLRLPCLHQSLPFLSMRSGHSIFNPNLTDARSDGRQTTRADSILREVGTPPPQARSGWTQERLNSLTYSPSHTYHYGGPIRSLNLSWTLDVPVDLRSWLSCSTRLPDLPVRRERRDMGGESQRCLIVFIHLRSP